MLKIRSAISIIAAAGIFAFVQANPYERCVEECMRSGIDEGTCRYEVCDPSDTVDVVETGQGNPLQLMSYELAGPAPVINGSLLSRNAADPSDMNALDEWKSACSRTLILSDSGIAQLFLVNTQDTLYLGITYEHGNNSDGSGVTLYFDEGSANPSEDMDHAGDFLLTSYGGFANEQACFQAKGSPTADMCWNGTDWIADGDGQTDFLAAQYYYNSDRKVHHYEFAIPLNNAKIDDASNSDLDVLSNEAIGFFLRVSKRGAGAGEFHWIETNGLNTRPDTFPHWGRIQLSVKREFFTLYTGRAIDSIPRIDGAINEAVWNGAYQRDMILSNFHYGTIDASIWCLEDPAGDTIYIGVRVYDDQTNGNDYCQIYLEETGENALDSIRDYDLDDMAENASRVDLFNAKSDLAWSMTAETWSADGEAADAQTAAALDYPSYSDYEFKMLRSAGAYDVDLPRGGLMGFLIRYHDGNRTGEDLANFYWEYTTNNDAQLLSQHQHPYKFLATGWANLRLGGPYFEMSSPVNGGYISDSFVVTVRIAGDSPASVVCFAASDTLHQTSLADMGGGTWSGTWTRGACSLGVQTFVVRATFADGTISERIVTVTLIDHDLQSPSVMLMDPSGGEQWAVGSTKSIAWSSSDNVDVVSRAIFLKTGSGGSWTLIDSSAADSGSGVYSWLLPSSPSDSNWIYVKVRDAGGNFAFDTVNAPFSMADIPHFTMTDSVRAREDSAFALRLSYVNNLGGTVTIGCLSKPSWLQSAADSLWGTPPVEAVDTAVLVLSVDGTGYDTLSLRIFALANAGIERLYHDRKASRLSLNVRTGSSCFLISLPDAGTCLLRVVDIAGRTVWEYSSPGTKAGFYRIPWNTKLKPRGTYIAVLRAGCRQIAKRFVMAR
ncbi:MAG: hypothetical protein JXA71_17620 [Chitinispirillaceae bacterium]|nr:hypothetical protein [Chitinispirillaceae bacterium]